MLPIQKQIKLKYMRKGATALREELGFGPLRAEGFAEYLCSVQLKYKG